MSVAMMAIFGGCGRLSVCFGVLWITWWPKQRKLSTKNDSPDAIVEVIHRKNGFRVHRIPFGSVTPL